MRLIDVKKTIEKFAQVVVAEAKNNLKKKNSSGTLANSLKYTFSEDEEQFLITFWSEEYGKYVDKGVEGAKTIYQGDQAPIKPFDRKKPYKYTNKMPPPSKLDKWIVRKGLAPRQKGKFTGRKIDTVGFAKSIQFLIARSIWSKGIKASKYFTTPLEAEYEKLGENIIKEFSISFDTIGDESKN